MLGKARQNWRDLEPEFQVSFQNHLAVVLDSVGRFAGAVPPTARRTLSAGKQHNLRLVLCVVAELGFHYIAVERSSSLNKVDAVRRKASAQVAAGDFEAEPGSIPVGCDCGYRNGMGVPDAGELLN